LLIAAHVGVAALDAPLQMQPKLTIVDCQDGRIRLRQF
jgi:hypothetical protein